jgi:hypothetical protein
MRNTKPITGNKQHSFRARLAIGTALATIAFGYGRGVAYAGVCTGSVGVYSCSGASAADTTQILNGPSLAVTTNSGFGINTTSGNALTLSSSSGITFTDTHSSAITGVEKGIRAVNSSAGSVNITTTGAVTGNSSNGIFAVNNGNGALSVSATGPVTGNTGDGIRVYNSSISLGNVTVTAGTVTGQNRGIFAVNQRAETATLSITSTGTVTGTNADGIYTRNRASSNTTVTVSSSSVTGATNGIDTLNLGTGTNTLNVSAAVTGGTGEGIRTRTSAGGSSLVTLNSGANISAASGIAISNNEGSSAVNVNGGAIVTGAISLGDGADNLIFDGGSFATVTTLDGGADTDTLTFRNVGGAVAGGSLTGWENVAVASGADISVSGTLNTGTLTVSNGGTLGGSGTINGNLTVDDGTLGPGNSPGLLSVVGNLDLGLTSTTLIELGGTTAGTQYDQIDIADDPASSPVVEGIATLTAGATFDIDFFGPFLASLGDSFDVLVTDDIVGDINSLIFDFSGAVLSDGLEWETSIIAAGNREALRITVSESELTAASDEPIVLPEPSGIALFTTSLMALFGLGRTRRRKRA